MVDRIAEAVAVRVEGFLQPGRAAADYMTVEEAATYLRCSKTRVYRLAASGELPHYKLGSRSLFSQREIDAWLAQSRNEPLPQQPRPRESRERGRSASRRVPEGAGLRAQSAPAPKLETRRRTRPVPLLHSGDEEHKRMWAKALGMGRADFDRLTPREFDRLWDERSARINALSQERKDALFDWDPKVERLSEMPIAEIEQLADRLIGASSAEDDSA